MAHQTSIYSTRCILESGIQPATIVFEASKIIAVYPNEKKEVGVFKDFGSSVIMPGLIDAHVHFNEPGRTDWEGFYTGSRAALAGGITTIVDMPLNSSPVTTNVAALRAKQEAANRSALIDAQFWGGLVPGSHDDLEDLLNAGVAGIKVFLVHSGIDEFPNVTQADLRKAMPVLARHNKPLLVHCELEPAEDHSEALRKNPESYQAYLQSRPKEMENKAIEMVIRLCREFQCPCHIVHLASEEALPMIAAARREGLPLTVETCAHYLYFEAEQIPDGDTRFKCAPPIRGKKTKEALWQALQDGLIDFITTDHSPSPEDMKYFAEGNLQKAWGGIASIQYLLPAVWTEARKRNIPLEKVVAWLSAKPAEFIGLQSCKGKIKAGYDADLVVWDPDKKFVVSKNNIAHRNKYTPYQDQELYGVVRYVFIKENDYSFDDS